MVYVLPFYDPSFIAKVRMFILPSLVITLFNPITLGIVYIINISSGHELASNSELLYKM